MTFLVQSTSTITPATKRVLAVLQRLDLPIHHAGVFNCRKISGSSAWSDHAFGAAGDLFPTSGGDQDDKRRRIAHAIIYQSTHRTKVNRFRRLVVRYVIDHDGRAIWTSQTGWRPYNGTTGNHVHGSFGKPPSGLPECAS